MNRPTFAACTLLTALVSSATAQQAVTPPPAALPTIPEWVSSMKFYGDIRLRADVIDDDSKDDTRTRERIRARLGLESQITEQVQAHFQLATGEDDPVSSNQTLTDSFSRKDFGLDLAYLKFSPVEDLKLHLYGGKMIKPFVSVADLIWDGDLNPEGLGATLELPVDALEVLLNVGAFSVEEDSSSDSKDRYLATGQAGLRVPVGSFKLLLGTGLYVYTDLEDGALLSDAEKGFGNSTRNIGTTEEPELVYANDFTELELFTELSGKVKDLPVALCAQYVVNTEADDQDTGYLVGGKLGKASKPGAFEVGYHYRSLEKNAVVGAFSDSDFIGGGTNGEGHKLSIAYGLAKNVQLGGAVLLNAKDPDGKDTDYVRWIFDLSTKF